MGLLRGVLYPLRGARMVYLEHPGLVRIWGVPILLTALAFAGAAWGALAWHGPLLDAVWSVPGGGGAWAAVGRGAHALASALLFIVLLVLGGVLVLGLAQVVAAPFNDALSERVEALRTGAEGPPFAVGAMLRDAARSVGLELVKLALWASVMLPLFLLSLLVPGVGQVVYGVVGFLFTAVYFALDYVDWPASRRGLGASARFGLLRGHPGTFFGFGAGVWALLFVPFVNLFFMPAAVAGGTLLFLDLEAGESAGGGGRPRPGSTGAVPPAGAA